MMRFLLSGVVAGAAHLHPGLWFLGFVGMALLVLALDRTGTRTVLLLGPTLHAHASFWMAHPWAFKTLKLYCSGTSVSYLVFEVATVGGVAFLLGLPLGLAAQRRSATWQAWMAAWVPAFWLLGEWLNDRVDGVSFNDWLYAQWEVAPVMRLVGHLGWTLAAWLCLVAAASVGKAWSAQRVALAWPALVVMVAMVALPELAMGDLDQLAKVGAVHAPTRLEYQHSIPEDVGLLVWPEEASVHHPRMAEGPVTNRRHLALPATGSAAHLLGVVTRSNGMDQNSVVAVAQDGTALAVRSKSRLFPLVERQFAGVTVGRDIFDPGQAPPVLDVAGSRVGILICFEALSRPLALAAMEEGARFLAISSQDRALVDDALAHEQFVAVAVLRAVETGLPVVRASLGGAALFVAANGVVLAHSPPGPAGILTLRAPVAASQLDAR